MEKKITDELTFKELILLVQSYGWYILSKWVFVLLFSIIVSALFTYKAFVDVEEYNAAVTFMLNQEDKNGFNGGIGSALSQLNLGGNGIGEENLNRIVALSRSRKITLNALLHSRVINGEKDFLGNHILNIYNYDEKWEENESESLIGFRFTHDTLDFSSEVQNVVLKDIKRLIVGSENRAGLISTSFDEDTGILTLEASTINAELSIEIAKSLYSSLSKFYVSKSTEKQKRTLSKISYRLDSVKTSLELAERELARTIDKSAFIVKRRDRVIELEANRKIKVLSTMYFELIKNKETASFLLDNSTPFFQVIDLPISPIDPEVKSIKKWGILGFGLGLFLSAFILFSWKTYKEIMR